VEARCRVCAAAAGWPAGGAPSTLPVLPESPALLPPSEKPPPTGRFPAGQSRMCLARPSESANTPSSSRSTSYPLAPAVPAALECQAPPDRPCPRYPLVTLRPHRAQRHSNDTRTTGDTVRRPARSRWRRPARVLRGRALRVELAQPARAAAERAVSAYLTLPPHRNDFPTRRGNDLDVRGGTAATRPESRPRQVVL
jgi:hypothetical protein